MKKQSGWIRKISWLAAFSASLFLAGCNDSGEDSSDNGGGLINLSDRVQVGQDEILMGADQLLADQATLEGVGGIWDWTKLVVYLGKITLHSKYAFNQWSTVRYPSTDTHGNSIELDALLINPSPVFGDKPSLPILLYQHGTEIVRDLSPTQCYYYRPKLSKCTPEVLIADIIARTGYIVLMVDYQGMGKNTDMQPYVHGKSLAKSVIDALITVDKNLFNNQNILPVNWNKKLYLMGYSEGGYATLATARELQENYAEKYSVTGVAPLDGPHDLGDVMRGSMLSDTPYKQPFFLPFIIGGYQSVYTSSGLFAYDRVLKSDFNKTIPPLLDGNHTAIDINKAMGMKYDSDNQPTDFIVAKSVLTDDFIADLTNTSSQVVKILRENNAYLTTDGSKAWVPKMPIRMYHHLEDDLVPARNSQVAFDKFNLKNVQLCDVPDEIDLGGGTVHGAAAVPALYHGWRWIYDGDKDGGSRCQTIP